MAALAEVLAQHTGEGELYERLPDGRLRCYACGHRCPLPDSPGSLAGQRNTVPRLEIQVNNRTLRATSRTASAQLGTTT